MRVAGLVLLVVPLLASSGCFGQYFGEASSARRALAEPDLDRVALAAVTARTHQRVYLHANLITVTTPNSMGAIRLRGYNRLLTAGVVVMATSPALAGIGAGIGVGFGGYAVIYGLSAGFLLSLIQFAVGNIITIAGIVRPSQELHGDAARVHFDMAHGLVF